MLLLLKAVSDSVLWPHGGQSCLDLLATSSSLANVLKGRALAFDDAPPPSSRGPGPAAGQGLTCRCSESPFVRQTPTLSPARVQGRPCQAGSRHQFPFPMPRSHVALRLTLLSPPWMAHQAWVRSSAWPPGWPKVLAAVGASRRGDSNQPSNARRQCGCQVLSWRMVPRIKA